MLKVKEEGKEGVLGALFFVGIVECLCGRVSLLLLEVVLVYIAGCVGARGSWSSLSDQTGFWAIIGISNLGWWLVMAGK